MVISADLADVGLGPVVATIRTIVSNTGTPTDSAPEASSTGAVAPSGTPCEGEFVSVRP